MAIRMRRGLEAELDISKAVPGEWLVSTDTRYIRMCFAPGIVLRMATYEAFEADTKKFMQQMEAILAETKTVQEAVERIQNEIENSVVAVENYVKSAKGYADLSNTYAMQSKRYSEESSGYAEDAYEEAERARMYAENAEAVTGVEIAKKDRAGIIKGGENYVAEDGTLTLTERTTDKTLYNSYEGGIKINEIGGASEQRTTTGAQLFEVVKGLVASNSGVKVKENADGTLSIVGEATEGGGIFALGSKFSGTDVVFSLKAGNYFVSGLPEGLGIYLYKTGQSVLNVYVKGGDAGFILEEDTEFCSISLRWSAGVKFNSPNTKIMLNEGTQAKPWEPFTGRKPSPSPDYPQEIKSVKGKNLLDCRWLVEQTINGVTFTPVKDKNGNLLYVEANGIASAKTDYNLTNNILWSEGEYVLSGCPSGGSTSTYNLAIYTNSDGNWTNSFGGDLNFLVSKDESIKLIATVRSGYTADHLRFYPMIRPASIADDTYVPYGLLRFWGHGKNLYSGADITGSYNRGGQFLKLADIKEKLTVGKTYTISFTTGNVAFNIGVLNTGGITKLCSANTRESITFTRTVEATSDALLYSNTTSTVAITMRDIQIEERTEATPYKPYRESAITLSKQFVLNGPSGVRDRFVRRDGVWGIERNVYKKVFDGTEDSIELSTGTVGKGYYFTYYDNKFLNSQKAHMKHGVLCNRLVEKTANDLYNYNEDGLACSNSTAGNIRFRFTSLAEITSVAELKAKLVEWYTEGEPLIVVSPTSEPTFEPLPTADQIALNSLVSFDGVTYLSCDSEVDPVIDVEYGTSKVGAYTLESWNKAENNRIKFDELVTATLMMNQE